MASTASHWTHECQDLVVPQQASSHEEGELLSDLQVHSQGEQSVCLAAQAGEAECIPVLRRRPASLQPSLSRQG